LRDAAYGVDSRLRTGITTLPADIGFRELVDFA
jgi:hypothetical protein